MFSGFFNNFLFIFVVILTFVVQMILVEIGGVAVKTHALTWQQNLICVLFGSLELIWGVLLKFVPLKFFQCVSIDEAPMVEEELERTFTNALKKSSTLKKSMTARGSSQLGK